MKQVRLVIWNDGLVEIQTIVLN